jgi:type IV pilus assembly protein PilN
MTIIEQLQRSRPEIVHVFDEIVRTLPDGVYLTGVKQNSTKLRFEGIAQSSTRVSSFMRNIDGSDWLKNPELEVVQTSKGNSTGGSSFTLTAEEVPNTAASEDVDGKGKKGGKPGKVMASNGGRQ